MLCLNYSWSMIFSENRCPPRIKSGAGFFGIMLWALMGKIDAERGSGAQSYGERPDNRSPIGRKDAR